MKKAKFNNTDYLHTVKYKWYQRWWVIILVILTIPTNYGFSVLLAGFLIYSRMKEQKLKR